MRRPQPHRRNTATTTNGKCVSFAKVTECVKRSKIRPSNIPGHAPLYIESITTGPQLPPPPWPPPPNPQPLPAYNTAQLYHYAFHGTDLPAPPSSPATAARTATVQPRINRQTAIAIRPTSQAAISLHQKPSAQTTSSRPSAKVSEG
jgi:hypothetical protein